jgi:hypothetical protein
MLRNTISPVKANSTVIATEVDSMIFVKSESREK